MQKNIVIVLVGTEHPGNLGAVARSMANFGFSKLVLVNPQCDHLSDEACRRAKHGKKVLEKALIVSSLDKVACDWFVGTSGKLGSDENIARLPVLPWQLSERLVQVRKKKVALVFGPESHGLSNEELQFCDVFVTIPAAPSYPVINLSHAVTILLYELFVAESSGEPFTPLGAKDKEVLLSLIDESLQVLPFPTDDKRVTQQRIWHRLIGKSFLTRREGFALMGFFKKVLKRR